MNKFQNNFYSEKKLSTKEDKSEKFDESSNLSNLEVNIVREDDDDSENHESDVEDDQSLQLYISIFCNFLTIIIYYSKCNKNNIVNIIQII